ncbi:immunoglobulin-binding protein 1-like isoform X2 [Diorhabda carinulata]|uniref:immunoglobulin-binding protein 1-like isoform X2 n=1 Tax=Diorhabda carinulata TaxID=1163345 RepID=UPI0025A30AA0|nr:immunoglobulin-binding protein 1-like isoform X2 [Diorhabda carinulata]
MAQNTKDTDETDIQTLDSMFKEGLENYNSIISSDQPTNSNELQTKIKKTMKTFEQATRLVSISSIFSTNEGIEEISTNDLQYFLLPAFLGSLTLKLTSKERKDIVDVAEIYFKDFLKRCNDYGMGSNQFKDKSEEKEKKEKTEFEKLEYSVNTRANKIQRFKEQKELKSKLEDLKKNMENEHADEEIKREYFLTMIKLFMHEAIDELNSIDMEKPILEHMANMKNEEKPQPKRPPPPLKPIVITKDDIQKAVFGAGYPSLPIMTVEEFYHKRVEDGIFPDPTKPKKGPTTLQQAAAAGLSLNQEEKEKEETEKLIEEDSDEHIARMRSRDEFKDEHRRGWGNRMNRS